jgi:glycosyltransferase involved in cell wall biosynthesis
MEIHKKKPKLAFVLPEYALHTHFRYVGEFATALREQTNIFFVLEKGDIPPEFPKEQAYIQQFAFPPLRFLEMGMVLLGLRLFGYRTQYVHYSFIAGFWSALWIKIFGGSMYYWNAGMPWLYKRDELREWFERTVFQMIDHLVTGADALHDGYARYYGIARERIATLPNWIDVSSVRSKSVHVDRASVRARLNIPDGAPVLLFVHRLAKRKGAHLLPSIFQGLQSAVGECVLLVIGEGPEREAIEEDFRKRGLLNNVRMLGSVPQEDVHEFYAIANLFLLPSEEEGFPHVITEAQVIGLPYVASNVGGVREMTPPEGQFSIVAYGDVPAFVNAGVQLLQSKAKYDNFSEAEKVWVERYDKQVILERFITLLFSKK